MFERRLKVFLAMLVLFTAVLVLRAAQVQVMEFGYWKREAFKTLQDTDRVETTRGEIRDRNGLRLAIDEPCVDAAIDFRALTPRPDDKWVAELARKRLGDRLGADWTTRVPRDRRKAMADEEAKKIRDDIDQMWPRLATISKKPVEEIEETRRAIVEKVKMRRRFIWYTTYELALKKHDGDARDAQTQPASVWRRWLLDDGPDAPDVDNFKLDVSEETSKHVVLHGIEKDLQTELGAYSERFPGLELRFSTRRLYPHGDVAAHVIGRLSKVVRDDMKNDPNFRDDLRHYEPNDLIGRDGVEGLCEPVLRGVRGRVEKLEGHEVAVTEAVRGRDVQITIDASLQEAVQSLFDSVLVRSKDADGRDLDAHVKMHGAAVVIDVASGEVLAMASAPSFDPNWLDDKYAEWADPQNLDEPMLNRATRVTREPGSTVKPMVGIAGVAEKVRGVDEGYECIGYMVVNGRVYTQGRCWVNSMFHNVLCPFGRACTRRPCPAVAHHVVPSDPQHPNGIPLLTLPDAIERSCNPYFESIAHGLGPVKLSEWYTKFGLGQPTYIGLPEAKGSVPTSAGLADRANEMFSTWTAGIGQGPVQATPLQVANVAATLARGGVWVRPRILRPDSAAAVGPTTRLADRVDLGLPPEALRAVKEGMIRVVNSPFGSGSAARRKDMIVAGKTGSAQAAPVRPIVRDPVTKKPLRDEHRKLVRTELRPSTYSDPNPAAPWYRDTGREGSEKPTLTHSWFMGYAPADDPQVAFAVLVEYGGGGGVAAGSVAKDVIQMCMAHGYLKAPAATQPVAAATSAGAPELGVELLHAVAR